FVVLVERACKAEELGKEKRKADYEARDSRKRSFSKSFQSASRKSREDHSRSKATAGFPKHDRDRPPMSSRAISVASVGSVRQNRSECKHCGKWHPGDCRLHDPSWFKCGSKDHFIRECLMVAEQNTVQSTRPSNVSVQGRPPRHMGNVSGSQRGTKDTAIQSEARAPGRAYAIRAREEASSPDVITEKRADFGHTCTHMCQGCYVCAVHTGMPPRLPHVYGTLPDT
nr:unnamed protein product [Gossypium raimondii]